jgi:hypothetical protein
MQRVYILSLWAAHADHSSILGFCTSESEALEAIVELKVRQQRSLEIQHRIEGTLAQWEIDHPRPRHALSSKDKVAMEAFSEWAKERMVYLRSILAMLNKDEKKDISDTGHSELDGDFSYEEVPWWKSNAPSMELQTEP